MLRVLNSHFTFIFSFKNIEPPVICCENQNELFVIFVLQLPSVFRKSIFLMDYQICGANILL